MSTATETREDTSTVELVVIAAQWDQTVPCRTETCDGEAVRALGINHYAGYACEVTVHYPACETCHAKVWAICEELARVNADYGRRCCGCQLVNVDVTDYIKYDRAL